MLGDFSNSAKLDQLCTHPSNNFVNIAVAILHIITFMVLFSIIQPYDSKGKIELIQFDKISAKGLKLCSGERSNVGRFQFYIIHPENGRCVVTCSRVKSWHISI
jgi:hypothetical protein